LLSEPQIHNITDKWPRITGPFRLSTRMPDGRSSPPTAATFDQARAVFEVEWQRFSVRRTPADYQAWRDQRDWTARKYAKWERGERFPSQQASR
jgi:hypothetical protein